MLIIKMMQGLSSWWLSKCICLTIKMKILDIIILPGAGPLSSLFMFELKTISWIHQGMKSGQSLFLLTV